MMRSLKTIIQLSGLSLENIRTHWSSVEGAINAWLSSRHLKKVTLEIYNPNTNKLVTRWDFDIDYSYSSADDGALWADPAAVRFAIAKAGVVASTCQYEFKLQAPGGANIYGWIDGEYRSTAGFYQHNVGTTIAATALGSTTSYWRKA
jgi:hypothetical protein